MHGSTSARGAASNHGDWKHVLGRLRGSTVRLDLREYAAPLAAIADLEAEARALTDEDILSRARQLAARARAGEPSSALRISFFALAREAARRTLDQRPFDEQVLAGLALADGHVVEMQTGEGKTLAAVLPVSLHALGGHGAHVLTFNDYLARRDAEWMGPVYRHLGLSVGYVEHGTAAAGRRLAYTADVTYVTAKEAGFDHLRDRLVMHPSEMVHRGFNFAVVDEADSLMIDEARTPLVIAGAACRMGDRALAIASLVATLTPGEHFDTDEYARDVELTEAGILHLERHLDCGSLHTPSNLSLLTEVNCALHARALLRRDVDYIVRDNRVEIVDDLTGRVIADRHWPDGLQAAVEAKEGLARRPDGRILGSMTVQRYLRGYARLSGMTGTAQDAADELFATYGLEVVVVPTHTPMIRVDHPDVIFSDRASKEAAVIEDIRRAREAGRPVLVGTASVAESERLSARLGDAGLPCAVLNARHDADEASIVAGSGAPGVITISTNMAGRGTDIRLGGPDGADRDRVAAAGGLYVIGTNRHESRRVDQQLRGRAGRQGDPGESRFFVSLEDDILVKYGIQNLLPSKVLKPSDGPAAHPLIRREVARVQRIVEGQNFEIRRTLARYAAVLEEQHARIGEWRVGLLTGTLRPDIWDLAGERRALLVADVGEDAVDSAERTVTLACLDEAWRDHLASCADIREGIHLVRLAGRDPLTTFTSEAIEAFRLMEEAIERRVLAALDVIRVTPSGIDLAGTAPPAPAATWTYLANDDPFEGRIGALLSGPGGRTVGMYAAAMLMPLLLAWTLVERFARRRRRPAGGTAAGGFR